MNKFLLIASVLFLPLHVYSQEIDTDTTEIAIEDELPDLPTSIIKSSNPNDYCMTVRFDELIREDCKDCKISDITMLTRDMDNDGYTEIVYLIQKAEECGVQICGAKKIGKEPIFDCESILLDKTYIKDCKISIMLHDFDNDGRDEVIIACLDMGTFVNGYVFKWLKKSGPTDRYFIPAGKFSSSSIPYIDKNKITIKAGIFGVIYKNFIYQDGKLSGPKDN